jgi:hypothetical protein
LGPAFGSDLANILEVAQVDMTAFFKSLDEAITASAKQFNAITARFSTIHLCDHPEQRR